VALGLCLLAAAATAAELRVYAAASLKPALDEILAMPAAKALGEIAPSYAASSALAKQIEAGAPADLFVSADEAWMDYLAERGHLVAGTRGDLLRNTLVLVAPAGSTARLAIAPQFDLLGALGDGRLALAEPNSVPAGKYAKAALQQLGVWESVQAHVVATENVRAALALAARDEVPLAITYRSDAVSEPKVREVAAFPPSSHAPIVYPAALVQGHDSAPARALLSLLRGAPARAVFLKYGFTLATP
jgi:molybdate transport system substrate-binding protein